MFFRNKVQFLFTATTILFIIKFSISPKPYTASEIHPFILYSVTDSAEVKERLNRDPYKQWFIEEVQKADDILALNADWSSGNISPETKAYYSKVLAFAWLLTDTADTRRSSWARESALILFNIPSGGYGSYFSSDLTLSEAVLFWAESYDCLKAGGFDFDLDGYQDVETTLRARFKSLRDYMARDTYSFFPSSPSVGSDFSSAAYWSAGSMDNHHVNLNAALIVLSLVILDESGSTEDLDHGLSRFRASINNLTATGADGEPSGGWAEGPNYNLYSAQQYLAAIQALKNTGIADIYSEIPKLTATHMLLPYEVMPDGYMPPFDDNEAVIFNLAGLLYSYHKGNSERDMLLWMWDLAGRPVPQGFRADYIAGFDDTPPVFSNPVDYGAKVTGFYPESGFARFRDSWDNDAVYMFFQSEHGDVHTKGQAHEHPDPNSFVLNAYGEMLILDSGYGGWENHDETRFAQNHNVILVDGEGPPAATQPFGFGTWSISGNGAVLTDSLSSANLDYTASETIYQNTSFVRHIVFPERRFFFVYDTLLSGAEVNYTMLLHGNGGGTSGGTFRLTGNGGVWERENSGLEAFVTGSKDSVLFQTAEMHHAVYERSPMKTHTMLKSSQTGASASFLTLLYPYRTGNGRPVISSPSFSGGKGICLTDNGKCYYGALSTGNEKIVITDKNLNIDSDGDFLYASVNGDSSINTLFYINGTCAEKMGNKIFESSSPINVFLDYSSQEEIICNVESVNPVNLTLYDIFVSRVQMNGQNVFYDIEGNDLKFTTSVSGEYVIKLSTANVIEPPYDFFVSDVPDDNGYQLKLNWTLSPSEKYGSVSWYRIFRSRNSELTDPVPITNFASWDSIRYYEQLYTVLVDSVPSGTTEYLDLVPVNGAIYHYWIQSVGIAGASKMVASGIKTFIKTSPSGFTLENAYPNPFNPSTTISFSIPEISYVKLSIYNLNGQKITTLADKEMSAGCHSFIWNAVDLSAGVYFYTLENMGRKLTRKMLLIK